MGSLQKHEFVRSLDAGPLLFDGAMGSEIANKGILHNQCFEELNLSQPELIASIHRSYVEAGSHVIQTNTYGAHRKSLARHSLESKVEEINRRGVLLAREASAEKTLVAGTVSSAGLQYETGSSTAEERKDLLDSFSEQITYLSDESVDLFVLESFESFELLELAMRAMKLYAPHTAVVAQLRFGPKVAVNDPSLVGSLASRLTELGADVIGANCGVDPADMFMVVQAMRRAVPGVPISAQPSIGSPRETDGRLLYSSGTDLFATFAKRFLNLGVTIIGGCCGTTPRHIRAMAGSVRMARNRSGADRVRTSPAPVAMPNRDNGSPLLETRIAKTTPIATRSRFGALLGKQFVTSVEVQPPASLDYSRAVGTTRKLIEGGATVINTTDGARANLRMDNLAFASIVQREVGCETILHVCCRDRNTLGLVSHLLAAHALGVKNLVIITGDPPKMGDFPNASPVYDMDSVGLLRLISNLNAGIDPAGRELKTPTQFVCGTGAEPGAFDYERELERVFLKKEAGAEFIMTQPVYERETMDRFLGDTESLGLPILMGVVPLASHRNAEFLHANVPGMSVPGDIRERMKLAGDGPAGRAEGLRIAIEAIRACEDRVDGAYIVPPLAQFDSAVEIIRSLRSSPSSPSWS